MTQVKLSRHDTYSLVHIKQKDNSVWWKNTWLNIHHHIITITASFVLVRFWLSKVVIQDTIHAEPEHRNRLSLNTILFTELGCCFCTLCVRKSSRETNLTPYCVQVLRSRYTVDTVFRWKYLHCERFVHIISTLVRLQHL